MRDASYVIPLEESRGWCARVTRARAANFYWGLRLAPEDRRPDLYAAYAWMRVADDIADGDEPQTGGACEACEGAFASVAERARLLDLFRHATHVALETRDLAAVDAASQRRWPSLWPAFIHACTRYDIDRAWWDASIDGMREDLNHHGYANQTSLEQYCYRVASTVGLICVAIWGLRRGASPYVARHAAIARGISFQLTNIVRDVGVDSTLSPARCYVPEELLDAHAMTHADLLAWKDPARCEAVLRVLINRAQELRRESMVLDSLVDPECLPVLRAMSGIYWRLLDTLDASPSRGVAVPAVRVPTIRKIGCMLGAILTGALDTSDGTQEVSR